MQLLLDLGCQCVYRDAENNTPLHFARDIATAEALLNRGCDIAAENKVGVGHYRHTTLHAFLYDASSVFLSAGRRNGVGTSDTSWTTIIEGSRSVLVSDKQGRWRCQTTAGICVLACCRMVCFEHETPLYLFASKLNSSVDTGRAARGQCSMGCCASSTPRLQGDKLDYLQEGPGELSASSSCHARFSVLDVDR